MPETKFFRQFAEAGTDVFSVIGHDHVWAQLIAVADAEAVPLGHLEGRADVVLALKRMQDWTSVYTLNPVLPAAFLRGLARLAGVHIYNDRDDTLYASRSYFCVNAAGSGQHVLRLPQPLDVFDPFTSQRLAGHARRIAHGLRHKETLLVRLARP